QPEFTQLDMEMAFVDEDDVIALVDGLLQAVLAVGGIEVTLPLDRVTYDEAMLSYGSDKPDRRPGMEIHDLGEVFAGSEFKVFAGALESGGVVRGLRATAELPRTRIEGLTAKAKSLGATGLVCAAVEADGARRGRASAGVLGGWGRGGGSHRITVREVKAEVFDAIGSPPEEARERFGFLLDALEYGAPPHGGIAFGFDRIVALLAGLDNIRD